MSAQFKVLIAEDDPGIAQMYATKFKHEGLNICHANDGKECLEQVAGFAPDMILLDVEMPNMNGLETLKRLKSDPKTKAIPVVMLTNLKADDKVKLAIEVGAEAYVVKSEADPSSVVDMVRGLISAKKHGR